MSEWVKKTYNELLRSQQSVTMPESTRARLREQAVAGAIPEYALFRDFYLEQMTRLQFVATEGGANTTALRPDPAVADAWEYFSPSNR